jgi:hypothetical protein
MMRRHGDCSALGWCWQQVASWVLVVRWLLHCGCRDRGLYQLAAALLQCRPWRLHVRDSGWTGAQQYDGSCLTTSACKPGWADFHGCGMLQIRSCLGSIVLKNPQTVCGTGQRTRFLSTFRVMLMTNCAV